MTPDHDLPPHDHPHDDLAAYALDALDADDHAAVEAHLSGCAACRAELDEHRTTLARLVGPAEEPPPSVWAGIAPQLPRLGQGRPGRPGRPDQPDEQTADGDVVALHAPLHARRPGLVERGGWLAAAAAFVVVLGLGAILVSRGGDDPASVADLAAAAADAPGATVVPLESEGGDVLARVVLDGEAGATDYVIFDGAAELPAGRSYQLWKTDGDGPAVSLGVLGDGRSDAVAIAAPAGVTSLALSDEPAAGVPQPTGPIVATGQRP